MGAALDLVYRYTVTGSSKASIDTGVDAPQAGSNDWTGGDVLEVFLIAQSTKAAAVDNIQVTVNNDTGSNYDQVNVRNSNATPAGSNTLAAANWNNQIHASTSTAGYPSPLVIEIPDYALTTFNKVGKLHAGTIDGTAGNTQDYEATVGWRSTAAITRMAIACSGSNLAIGSQLLIYKRVATTDSKISALTAATALASTDELVLNNAGVSKKITGASLRASLVAIGGSVLVYRYTVTGSDKASIDTGADTPDAGSNDWTNGDLLEIYIISRTDEAAVASNVLVTLNNDTSAVYDAQVIQGEGGTAAAGNANSLSGWTLPTHGSSGIASYPGQILIHCADYAGTTFLKTLNELESRADVSAVHSGARALGYRSTSAITRLKVAGISTVKLKVGSQLLIYKRLAS